MLTKEVLPPRQPKKHDREVMWFVILCASMLAYDAFLILSCMVSL